MPIGRGGEKPSKKRTGVDVLPKQNELISSFNFFSFIFFIFNNL